MKILLTKILIAVIFTGMLLIGAKNTKTADILKVNRDEIKTTVVTYDNISNKKDCMNAATEIINSETITHMSTKAVAKEIYTHYFIYNVINSMPSWLTNNSLVQKVYNSASNGADLESYGDTFLRRMTYSIIWVVC